MDCGLQLQFPAIGEGGRLQPAGGSQVRYAVRASNETSPAAHGLIPHLLRGNRVILLQLFLLLLLGITVSCKNKPDAAADTSVTSLGSTEVTAELLAIPGEFPPNDLYNYAYVLKYRVLTVHRGQVKQGEEILVAHYNPLKPRASAADENSGNLGGTLQRFKAANVHRMALEAPLDQHWMGGVIDKYFDQKGTRYWAVWTNLAKP